MSYLFIYNVYKPFFCLFFLFAGEMGFIMKERLKSVENSKYRSVVDWGRGQTPLGNSETLDFRLRRRQPISREDGGSRTSSRQF